MAQYIKLNGKYFLVLNSVGSVVDEDMVIHPLNSDNTIDFNEDMATPMQEGSDEWFNSLSDSDRKLIWAEFKYDASHTDDLPK